MRPANPLRSSKLTTTLPIPVRRRLDSYLKRVGGGSIAPGAYRHFLVERITEFLDRVAHD